MQISQEEKELFRKSSSERFIKEFRPNQKASNVVRDLLETAIESRDEAEIDLSLLFACVIGFSREHFSLLIKLLYQEWHHTHEDLVRYIEVFADEESIDVLTWAAQVRLDYLSYNDSEALARKAIYALKKIGSPKAQEKLSFIAETSDGKRKGWAMKKLKECQDL